MNADEESEKLCRVFQGGVVRVPLDVELYPNEDAGYVADLPSKVWMQPEEPNVDILRAYVLEQDTFPMWSAFATMRFDCLRPGVYLMLPAVRLFVERRRQNLCQFLWMTETHYSIPLATPAIVSTETMHEIQQCVDMQRAGINADDYILMRRI